MVNQHYRWDFYALSTDTKPTPETSEKVTDGSTFYCSDTSKLYVWCRDNWYEKVVEGGGGTTYTAGDGIDITGTTISATNTGESKVLTSDDFNWNYETGTTESPNAVALWLLPSGLYGYNGDYNIPVYLTPYQNWTGTGGLFLISPLKEDINCVTISALPISGSDIPQYTVSLTDGSIYGQNIFPSNNGVTAMISSYIQTGYGAPSNTDAGTLGKMYVDTSTGTIYYCSNIDTSDPDHYIYTWTDLTSGGVTPVQTTGTSTTDVMSQNATTSMIYRDPSTRTRVQIGKNASTNGDNGVAIGNTCIANGSNVAIGDGSFARYSYGDVAIGYGAVTGDHRYSVALGSGALTRNQGEINVGTYNYNGTMINQGYNNTGYRIITDLHDGQGLHHAATVAQGNTLATSAPTTTTQGVLGQLYTDTTTLHTYQCTAIDTTDPDNPSYTWQQRW